MARRLLLSLVAAQVVACAGEEAPPPAVVAPPPPPAAVVVAPAPPAAAPAPSAAPSSPLAPPVMAKFVDVSAKGDKVAVGSRCDVLFVAAAKGAFSAAGQALAQGDTLMVRHVDSGAIELKGTGLAVVVTSLHDCPAGAAPEAMSTRVAHAGDAKDLAWAGGTMHAHLDLEKDVSPDVYIGRLEGTAAVAEHDHPTSWEVMCAVEGSGTFTLDGVARHVVGPSVIAVPPGRKHAWQPDPGVKLVAVQAYAPPGPEQRFKALSKP